MKRLIATCAKFWQKLSGQKPYRLFSFLLVIAVSFIVIIVQPAIATRSQHVINNQSQPTLTAQSAAPSLLEQGNRLYEEGRLTEAVSLWQQALQIYRDRQQQSTDSAKLNAQLNEALCLSYLSIAYQDLGEWQQAQTAIANSTDLLKKASPSSIEGVAIAARVKNTQGSLQLAMGQSEVALTSWQEAAALYAQIGDEVGQLGSQINQAQALQSLGLYRQANEQLGAIELRLQKQPASLLKAVALRSLGTTLQTLGNLPKSQKLLEQSLEIAQELNNSNETSAALLSLGNNFRLAESNEVALQTYGKAIKVTPNRLLSLEAQAAQLSLLANLNRDQDSQTLWQQIEPQLENLKPSRRSVYLRVNIADSLTKIDKLKPDAITATKIADLLTVATRQAQDLQDRRAESFAIGEMGKLYAQNQRFPEALQFAERALVIAETTNDNNLLYQWQWLLGQILNRQGQYERAIAAYSQAVENVQELRKDLITSTSEVQFAFRDRIEPIYRELVALLLRDEQPSPKNLKQAQLTLEALQVVELENFFRAVCLDIKPQAVNTIDSKSAVIYSAVLPDRLAVILSLPNAPLRYYATAKSEAEVEATTDLLLQSLNTAFSDRERLRVSQKLYDWLIRPAEADLNKQQIKHLVFVLDSSLRNLPIAALHDGQQYAVAKYSIAFTPGLQLLGAQPLDRDQLKVWIGALAESRQGFSDLEGVKQEAARISSQIPAILELDHSFTKSELQKGVGQSNTPIVHLATHGQFSSALESTFILAWDARITVTDFYQFLRDRADNQSSPLELLVLSACQTAEGDRRAALGLAGLALRSGARSTIGSLWAVNDLSTTMLMSNFYENLTKQPILSRAESLQKAQLALLQDPQYQHPYYWAAFVLVGSWL